MGAVMQSHIARLTPQMLYYTEQLYEDGKLRWLPYVMYFQPENHRSDIVNTDRLGFRVSSNGTRESSVAGSRPAGSANVLVGGSTVFGVGATTDDSTVPSRLWSKYSPEHVWVNFGGRAHNSAQELVNFLLHRHLLPEIRNIVLLSGLNNLGLARLPLPVRGEHGAFYHCSEFNEIMYERHRPPRPSALSQILRRDQKAPPSKHVAPPVPPAAEQIEIATDLTLRHLGSWQLLADALGATLSFAFQPLATWVRDRPAPQEQLLFDELDEVFSFRQAYGDIVPRQVGRSYATALRAGCERLGIPFMDLSPLIADAAAPDDWLFVDRAHLTDLGHDFVAALLARHLDLR
ncbi:SGNH/GDSL hydrolase family protein [Plantactinospora sp. KLBMP9567]|uniref:SGNH/GDSL hydrolase family protein n=1 Tax=Plantactinospora sp. KLBMP9567 TaxID=3085900 RepID=UPI0029813348|nr:SGNH/GDSL hydrolase family protein [Plantactinospora sp. KLBMP9567]MDW5328901.1 SGNH/GDSL hydrolase family protein [Plantactinospora sp. KLBMP9567]